MMVPQGGLRQGSACVPFAPAEPMEAWCCWGYHLMSLLRSKLFAFVERPAVLLRGWSLIASGTSSGAKDLFSKSFNGLLKDGASVDFGSSSKWLCPFLGQIHEMTGARHFGIVSK